MEQTSVLSPKPKKLFQIMVALVTSMGAFATGVGIGWTSTTEDTILEGHAYDFKVNKNQFSWVGAYFSLGAAINSMPTGFLIHFIGLRNTMTLLVIPFTVGWILIIWAESIEMLWIGRFITGMATGSIFVIAPLYIGEIASKHIRGNLGSLFQIMLTIGILLSNALGWKLEIFTMSLISGVFPIIFCVMIVFMPETPSFLYSVGKIEAAKDSIQRIRGKNYDYTQELDEIKLEYDAYAEISLYKSMIKKVTLKPLFICSGLMAFQQLSGINAIIFYPEEIFADGHTKGEHHIFAVTLTIIQVIATIICGIAIDYTGRRISLLFSCGMITVCTSLIGVFFYIHQKDENPEKGFSLFPVMGLCFYMVAFSLGLGPCPWILMGELFSTKTKGVASGIVNTFKWLSAFGITKSFINLKYWLGKGPTFWVFAFFTATSCIFIEYFLPETNGKSFAEIQQMFTGNWRKMAKESTENEITTANVIQSSYNILKKKKNKIYPF